MSKLNYGDMSWDDLLKSSLYMNATETNKAAMQNEWLDSFMADFTQDEIQNDAPYLTDRLLKQTTVSQGQVYNALLRAGYRMPKQDAVAFNPEAYTPTVGDKVLDIYKGVGLSAQSGFAKGVNLLEAIPEAVARGNAALGSYAYPYEMKNGHATNIPNQTAKKYKEYSEKALDRMEKRTQEAREMLAKNNVNQAVWRPLLNGDFGEATQGALNSFVDGMVHQMFQAGLAWATGGLTSTALMGLSVQEEKFAELRHDNTHSELQKNAVATLDGIWEALFEHFGSEQLFKKLKMGEGSLLDAWRKDPSSKSMLKGVVKSLLGPFLREGSEEFITEVFQNITDRLGQAHDLDEFKKLWKETNWWEIFHNAMEAGLAGGLIGLGMGAPSIVSQYKVIQAERNANAYSRAAFNYYMGNAKEDRMPAKYASEEQRREALDDYLKKGKPITFDEPTPQDWYRSYVARLSELEEQGIDMDSEGEDGDTYRKIRERFNAFVQTPEGKAVHDQIVAEYQQRIEQEAAQQAQQEQQEQPVEPPAPVEQQPVETPAPVEQPKDNKFPTKQKVDPKSQYSVDYKPGETKITDTNGEEAQVTVIGDKPQIRYFADEQSGVKGYWAFVSAKTLEVSKWLNNATQNRDMSTKQSRETVAAIKNGLKNNPSQTLDSRTVDHGAPTVIPVNDEKGNTHLQVHFGNHRAEATIEGYSDAEIAQALRTVATEHAQKNNIDISSIQDPILVFIESEAQTVEQVQQGTQRGNHTATRQMTPSQNAQSDALLLAQHPEVLKKFVPGGNLSTDNFDFLRDFMQITDTTNAGLLDEKNRPTMEAENRVARAMFAYFLRNESPERQERMLKSVIDNAGDNNIVSLVRGIMSNAPSLAQLEEKFPDYAIGKEMINALDSYLEYKRARSKGEFNNIENWFNQTTMDFGDKNQKKLDLNDVEKDLARIFDKVKTIKGIRTFFNTFTDTVHEEAGGEGLFSDVQKRTKAEIIHDLAQKTLEPEEETSGTTANASVENESAEHAPRVESARVADVTQEGQQTTNEAVQEKRKNIDDAVRVAQRLFPNYTFKVYDKVTDLPENIRNGLPNYIRDYIDKNGELPEGIRVEAANDGMRTIHILADQMPSDPAAIRQRIMTHEIVGHDGLKQLLGNRYDKMLDSVYADHKNDIKPIAKLYGYNLNKVEELREATEEWLARNADIENSPSWFNRLVAKIRATLRVMFNIKWSDNDIRSCFIEAARNLQEQSGSQHIRFAISDSQATLDVADETVRAIANLPTRIAENGTSRELPVDGARKSNILPTKENASQEGENNSGDGVVNEAIRMYFKNNHKKHSQDSNQLEFDFDYEQREETLSEGERRSQEDARRDAIDCLRRCNGSLLGLKITKDFKSHGITSLVGKRITSASDLADAAQIFRNPHFETLRYVFVKNGEVVYANAVTSRMPGSSAAFIGDASSFLSDLKKQFDASGADGYYLLHNHPSGNVHPSFADRSCTEGVVKKLGNGFLGHIVIDHEKYGIIDRFGGIASYSFKPSTDVNQYDPEKNPSLPHSLLGMDIHDNGILAIATQRIQAANSIPNGSVVLFGTNPSMDINCIATIPIDEIKSFGDKRIYVMARQLGRISASSYFFLGNVDAKSSNYFENALKSGLLVDAVLTNGTSLRQQLNLPSSVKYTLGLSINAKSAVTENTSDVNYSLMAEQPTPGNPDSVDQRIYADHVAKAVAQTPIENLRAMRLPLILELARKLKGDVKAVDRIPIDGARGVFYHGSRLIEVLRELAKPQLLEKDIIVPQADVARQRQLWEDYWTKAGVPLNEIEIVETPVGGDVRMYAIRHDRTLARFRKTAGHEVGHLIDYNTGETTSHGNVLGTVGGMLKGWLMNVIGETPSTQVDKASLNQLRKQLHKQAETIVSQTTPKPKSTDKAALDAWRQAVSDKYHELFVDECDRNAWFRREVVREETVDLTRWWSGEFFGLKPSYVEYRQKPTELFAETMSVLLNAPDELMKRSPETWRLIQNYQSNKPEFHKAWRQLMDLMNDETAYAKSLLEIQRRGFDAGEVAALAAIRNNPSFSFEDSWMAFKRNFVNKFANIADASKQVVRNGQMVFDDTPLAAVTAAQHASVKDYYMKMGNRLAQPLLDMGLTEKDIGLYMQNKRIENDPSLNDTDRGILNPNGLTAEDATLALEELHRQLGDKKWDALEQWHKDFWQLRQDTIIQMMEDSGAYSQELLDHVRDNEWYAYRKIISTLYGKDGAAHDNGSAKIYGLKGTVSDAANPLAWTFENDLRIMGGILWNTARMRTVDLMQQFFPNMIQKPGVEGRMTNGRLVMKDAPDGFTRMYVLREGKLEQWDVADAFAVGFSGVVDEDLYSLMSGLSKATNWFRMGWTTYSPTFFVNNVIRDYLSTYQNFTEKNSPGLFQWTKYWALGMKEAFGDEFGWTSAVIDEMERQNMFQSAQQGHGEIVRQGTELSRLMDKYQLLPTKTLRQRVFGDSLNPIKMLATLMEHLVSATERGAKAGGYLAMQDRMSGLSTDEMRYHVVKHIGSPDFATRGTKTFVTNTLFVFSNAAIQGWSATAESAKASPGAYGMRWMATTGVATLLTWAMSSGALLAALRGMGMDDDDDLIKFLEWMKKMYGKITHYNRFNYACLPIGETDDGQAVYIRIPYAENSRVSAMIFKGLLEEAYNETPKSYGAATETARAVGSMATNTNPIIAALLDLAMFGQGYNIYDRHYGRPKVKTEDFNAGGLWRAKGIGSYMYREYSPYNFMKWDPENPNFWYDLIGTTLGWGTLVRKSSAGEKEAKREKNQLQRQIKASQLIKRRKKN